MIGILIAAALAGSGSTHACRVVEGDRIRMRDLARVDARFAGADPEQLVGLSPEPGSRRVLWPPELMRLAARSDVTSDLPFRQVCFERETRLLSAEEMIAAIRVWAAAGASIEVLAQSNFPVPVGDLVLPRPQSARLAEDHSLLLRGYVRFGAAQRFPVWARVRVVSKTQMVIPVEDIRAGTEIVAGQFRIEERDGGIDASRLAGSAGQVAGRVARRRLAAGQPVMLDALQEAQPVMRGAIVKVEVRAGAARLAFDGLAERSGRAGEMVTVRNPSTGKAFLARVTGENAVLVIPGGVHLEGMGK